MACTSWTYTGERGCQHWHESFPVCKTGKRQSPIAISQSAVTAASHGHYNNHVLGNKTNGSSLPEVELVNCGTIDCRTFSNGFTAQFDAIPHEKTGKIIFLKVNRCEHELLQFHFHSPSEHTLDGKHGKLELHLVTRNMTDRSQLAVVGFIFDTFEGVNRSVDNGSDSLKKNVGSEFLERVFHVLPQVPGQVPEKVGSDVVDLTLLKHEVELECHGEPMRFFQYDGSLTTPPCTENVTWFVFSKMLPITPIQLFQYTSLFEEETNRPVQPLFGRTIKLITNTLFSGKSLVKKEYVDMNDSEENVKDDMEDNGDENNEDDKIKMANEVEVIDDGGVWPTALPVPHHKKFF